MAIPSEKHDFQINSHVIADTDIGDFLAGALYREFREFMRILTTFLGKNPQESIIIRVFRPFVLIMMDFCGFLQGKSSEFA